ncbi:glycosyltransferase family 2 protein [Paraburkholderia fungorum]|uniref:glycosyltransferase family 2 protein n=1 Tax=Paraburkholderia fungorum TaxID=134537 RepID=UPI002097E995|nr:glycosyltransferase family 2 protein [Paraburkholderia fungorum]USX11079.1 glycosyltransferase family 2 protein [Paraburkholderia fungorum]
MKKNALNSRSQVVLSVSVVVFRPQGSQLERTLESLAAAARPLSLHYPGAKVEVVVIDNGGGDVAQTLMKTLSDVGLRSKYVAGHGNVGYGRGHNLAIEQTSSRYHLVLNPDVDLDAGALLNGLTFLDANPAVGLVTPWVGDSGGRQQYLCRRFPSVLDLFIRGFLPLRLRGKLPRRFTRYEMRDVIDERNVVWDPPIVSGCFMLFRTDVIKRLNGFDPRYFLYFEDYDLSLRTHEVARVVYVPWIRILHYGGGVAHKGWTHRKLFAASAFKFFNRFGWKWL